MAGKSQAQKSNVSAQLREAKAEIQLLEAKIKELEQIAARSDYKAFLKTLPEPVKEYTDEIPGRVLAMASVGMSIVEIQAELGLDDEKCKKWKQAYKPFTVALSRARVGARAYWMRQGRKAIDSNNWKFQLHQLPTLINSLFPEEEQELGDASELVVVAIGQSARDMLSRAKSGQSSTATGDLAERSELEDSSE